MENNIQSINENFRKFIIDKLTYYNTVLLNTIPIINKHKSINILTVSEINLALADIEDIHRQIREIENKLHEWCENDIENENNKEEILKYLQKCNDSFYSLFKDYGTQKISDILNVCFGNKYVYETIINKNDDDELRSKFELLNKYSNPFHFKIIQWKGGNKPYIGELNKSKFIEDTIISEKSSNIECFDIVSDTLHFQVKVYGARVCFQNYEQKKTIIIDCIFHNTIIKYLRNKYLVNRLNSLTNNIPNGSYFNDKHIFNNFVNSLTIKELCIYNNKEIYDRFVGYINQGELMKQKPITQIVKEFINSDLYNQRATLIQLLIHGENPEYNYISYLLYDLLSNDENGNIDTQEQTTIFDSLPWNIKKLFKNAMRTTVNYTKSLVNMNNNKIPIEQQICLMKVSDSVKEKAMTKLKEVKAKSEDSGSKARQYLEGLLRIPFGVYKEEPVLKLVKTCSDEFNKYLKTNNLYNDLNISEKDTYTILEIQKHTNFIRNNVIPFKNKEFNNDFYDFLRNKKRESLVQITQITNKFNKENKILYNRLLHSAKKNNYLIASLYDYYISLQNISINTNQTQLLNKYLDLINYPKTNSIISINNGLTVVDEKWKNVKDNVTNIRTILDDAVYGHENAKRQLERVIGQWMSGKQTGYCFGFEGPPGLGKTSIAKKGLSKCLVDENGATRPFGFIAIGGSSNSSTLDGHNYTYVGSTWGRIVDILMESKCMNPIIFIDELDKISKTEQGKEIIGILTHLVDPTQNDEFHDKYFSGIDIDLSNVLFVFSYNDVSLLDRILLDRIHRIQFKNLTLEEKIVIAQKHLLPEIYEKIHVDGMINISDDVIRYIIETYTVEPGVRKLKEILFEILSEINLEILNGNTDDFIYVDESTGKTCILLTKDMIKNKYLKERREIKEKKIHDNSEVGIINGLWANSMGQGGIIPIQCNYFPTSTFLDLKLTGMQGDVMKESMNVAKTIAYKMTTKERQKELLEAFKDTQMHGLHIHCPEGAVPKDGPSAGTAITTTIYSLLNNKKIKNNVAITGEINLQGNVTAIGGLDLKILGGIKAGVTEFIYPKENNEDFKKFMEKYENNEMLDNISFYEIEHINDVFELVFENCCYHKK